MKLALAMAVLLLAEVATGLTVNSGVTPAAAAGAVHEGSASLHGYQYNSPQYRNFLRFVNEINGMNNYAGFIRRSLFINYQYQYPQLERTFLEIHVGIQAIKKVLIHNSLLVNSYHKMCPKQGTFNSVQISRYLDYTIQKETIAVDIITRTPPLYSLLSSAHKMFKAANKYVELVRKTMAGDYCNQVAHPPPPVKPPVQLFFKNNLAASNWYYGTTTQARYIAKLEGMLAKHNLTNCPISKPYVRSG
jgi:hypothetical protein